MLKILDILQKVCFNHRELEQTIITELKQCESNQSTYMDENKDYKFGRFIDLSNIEEVKFFYGLDRLLEEDLLCEIDWKSDLYDVEYCIVSLFNINGIKDISLNMPEEDEELSELTFEMINVSILNDTLFNIILIDINSDSYVFGLIKK